MVEDEPGGREPLAAFLRRRGYKVVCVGTVKAGFAELARGEVTHVILDLRLPDGNGLPLLAEAHQSWPEVQVAIVTGADRGDLLAEAVLLKPDAFLRKPVDFRELLAWVEGGVPSLGEYLSAGGVTSPSTTHYRGR